MKCECGVMIGTGEQYQEHHALERCTDGAPLGFNEGVAMWSIDCEMIVGGVWTVDDEDRFRLSLHPAGDDADSEQPPVHLYIDTDEWEAIKFMVDAAIRKHEEGEA